MHQVVVTPPSSRVEPVTDVLHGVAVTDPYRWLEDSNSAPTKRWLAEQATYVRAYFDRLTGRTRIRSRVEELLAVEMISDPWKVGNRYFYLKRAPRGEQPAIMLREGDSGQEITLIDPSDRDRSGKTAVGILNISAGGRLLAYTVRQGGVDSYAVEFLNVDKKQVLSDRLPQGFCRGLIFTPDERGFYYSWEDISSTFHPRRAVFRHIFAADHQQDTEVFLRSDDPNLRLILSSSPSGKRLGYLKLFLTDPKTIDFLIQDIDDGAPPRPVVEQIEPIFAPLLMEDGLLALTDWQAPNCRVVKIHLARPDQRNWCDVVPESGSRIHGIALVGESIFVTSVKDLVAKIEVFSVTGKKIREIPWPTAGTAHLLPCRPDADTVFYKFTSFAHPTRILRHRIDAQEYETWAPSKVNFCSASIEVEKASYPSTDGTEIPITLIRRRRQRPSGGLPTFLTGYGGFGNSLTPRFTAYGTYLIERGCLFALANLRGGAEFGEAWHLAAKRQKRQTAIDDFLAAAEWLLARSYTEPGRLAIGGGSNAGLLVGAALTQRPHLFRAVLCLGPLLDMLRYHLFDSAAKWIDEYGSAKIKTDFETLACYSPYHAINDGVPYPAVLLISGDADTRCNPMHARKMTARLQAATTSEHPILLDYRSAWGHTPVQPLTTRIEALTDRLAFLCNELGLDV